MSPFFGQKQQFFNRKLLIFYPNRVYLAQKVNNGGRIVQTFQWNSIPLSFKFAGDFLFISHFYNLEIIKIGVNQESIKN